MALFGVGARVGCLVLFFCGDGLVWCWSCWGAAGGGRWGFVWIQGPRLGRGGGICGTSLSPAGTRFESSASRVYMLKKMCVLLEDGMDTIRKRIFFFFCFL